MRSRSEEVGVEQEGGKVEVAAAEGVGRAGGASPIYRISTVDTGSPSSLEPRELRPVFVLFSFLLIGVFGTFVLFLVSFASCS